MSKYSIKDYTNFFQYKELDRIRNQPTLDYLINLLRQVKINAQNVTATLGGGQLGYLALVISETDYNAIPNSRHFVSPTHPGVFVVNTIAARVGATTRGASETENPEISQIDIANQKVVHEETEDSITNSML